MVPSVADLPQKVVDLIIDHLDDDTESLLSCSQIARPWLRRSRYHLFYALWLDPEEHDMMNFLHLLVTTPTIADAIHYLNISSAPDVWIRASLLDRILKLLPSLAALNISTQIRPLVATTQRYFDIPGPALDSLDYCVDMIPLEDFLRTIAAFSRIPIRHTLTIQTLFTNVMPSGPEKVNVPRFVPTRWQVPQLCVPLKFQNSLFTMLSLMLDMTVLRHLSIGYDAAQCLTVSQGGLRVFMSQFGPTLRILDWNLRSWYVQSPENHYPLLDACKALEIVRFELGTDLQSRSGGGVNRTALFPGALLDHLPHTLRILILSFGESKDEFALIASWVRSLRGARLEKKFQRFPRLTQVVIAFQPGVGFESAEPTTIPEEYQKAIRERLPELNQADKLRFPTSGCIPDCIDCVDSKCESGIYCTEHTLEYCEDD